MAVKVFSLLMLVIASVGHVCCREAWSRDKLTEEVEKMQSQIISMTERGDKLADEVKELRKEKEYMSQTVRALAPLPEQVEKLRDRATAVEKLTHTLIERRAAFFFEAEIGGHLTIPQDTPVKLGRVRFNIGNGYDPSTGVFTAPYTGTYIFAFQLFPARTEVSVMADLYKNGEIVLRNRVGNIGGGRNEETLTATAIQRANAGDRFWIQIVEGGGTFWEAYHTFFSGSLVSVDL